MYSNEYIWKPYSCLECPFNCYKKKNYDTRRKTKRKGTIVKCT